MFAPGVGAVFLWLQKIVDIHRGLGIMVLFRGCGGIGRRVRLKIWCPLRTYRFDPDHRYYYEAIQLLDRFFYFKMLAFYYINCT